MVYIIISINTRIRDPLSRAISHYFYAKKSTGHYLNKKINDNKLKLSNYLLDDVTLEMDNGQVRVLSGDLDSTPCEQKLLDKAIENIESYSIFVGISEQYSKSIEILTKFLCWNQKPIILNLNKGSYNSHDVSLSSSEIELFLEKNKYDFYLYNLFLKKLNNS